MGVRGPGRGDALIVTTGSTDLPYPFPGATYPGVFSGRGLQILINRYRVRPGRRFAIIGGAGDAEELAVDIMLAGGEMVWSGIAPAPFLRAEGVDGVNGLWVGQRGARGRRHCHRGGAPAGSSTGHDGRRAARLRCRAWWSGAGPR